MIEASQYTIKYLLPSGDALICYEFDLGGIYVNALTINHVTKELWSLECLLHEPPVDDSPTSGEPSVHKDPAFDDLDDFVDVDDTLDYMEIGDTQDEGRTSSMVLEEKESANEGVSTEAPVSTVKPNKGTDKKNEGTADQNEGKSATQTAPTTTSTPTSTPTLTIFGDDETIAQVLITMSQNKQKEKEKGIDPKDKGKKRIEEEDESDTESEGITEAEKKFKQLANDEEMARKVQEEWEAEEEKKRLDEEEATKAALSNEYDFIQARLNADKILAEKLQEEERKIYKRSGYSFIAIGSAKDEKIIKEMMNKLLIASKKRVKKDDSVKGEIKEEEGTIKRKLRKRKKIKSKKRKFTSKDDEELRLCLTIAPDEDKEVDYEILDKSTNQ
ncbi:hypothetical protein Tco_0242712 [Tanacetum coccineum]